ncbi:MAG: anaerobic ribonucleoside-triphosphate reductase [Minisyncoccales bacterium]
MNKKEKIYCHDCQKEIKTFGKKIENGKMLVYQNGKEKIFVFKCSDCFEKSKELRNYQPCEVYSRIVGYLRPIQQWNLGKQREYKERKEYIF